MIRKIFLVAILVLFSLTIISPVFAQASTKVTVDLQKIDNVTRDNIIKHLNKEKEVELPTKDKVKEYTEMGVAIGEVLKSVCGTLSIEVNKFAETKIGVLTTWLIIYKVVGKDILHIVSGILIWAIIMGLLILSFTKIHFPKKIVTRNPDKTKTIQYIERFKFKEDLDGRSASIFTHYSVFIILNALIIFKIF